MAYKPVPAENRPPNKSHYPKSSAGSKASGDLNGSKSFEKRNYIRYSDLYYKRDTKQGISSKYFKGSISRNRSVDPHDKHEVVFDISERNAHMAHERRESSRARRTHAQEAFLPYGFVRDEGQASEFPDGTIIDDIPQYTSFDELMHRAGEKSDHDKRIETDSLRYNHEMATTKRKLRAFKHSENSKTLRAFLQGLFLNRSEKNRIRGYRRTMKSFAKQQRRTIAMKRGYW